MGTACRVPVLTIRFVFSKGVRHMRTMRKYCKTIKAAERYQNMLYERFNHVQLIRSPLSTEQGEYVWEVK